MLTNHSVLRRNDVGHRVRKLHGPCGLRQPPPVGHDSRLVQRRVANYPNACTTLTKQDAESALGEPVDGAGTYEPNSNGCGPCTYSNDAHGASPQPSTSPHDADTAGFSAVDHTADPSFYVNFMVEGHQLPDIVAVRMLATELLELRAGHRVLDVGCGPALDAADLAARVGPRGELVGIDLSETMIATARRHAGDLDTPTHFEVASAYELPFDDASFDGCRAERLFMHLLEPHKALREMRRVTRRGGRVCVVDFDWHTLLIDHPDQDTTEMLVRGFADELADGRIGRKLRRMFVDTGLPQPDIRLQPVRLTHQFSELLLAGYLARRLADGRLRPDQVRSWRDQLKTTVDNQTYFMAVTSVIASAAKQ
jgi:SAM-dependent methyltransferase